MKIRIHGMLGTNHSWSFTSQYLARAILNLNEGHEIFLKSTNNLEHFPNDLKPHLIPGYHGPLVLGKADYITESGKQILVDPKTPLPELRDQHYPYDLEFCYSILYQIPRRFYHTSRCRMMIWNFESSILPPGWHLYCRALDYLLPSSQFSLDIFAQNGVPKDKMVVIPHGVDTNMFNPNIPPFKLKTEKKIKFLHNAIPHHRKLHERMIKCYLDTFTGDDDVCLVLKTKFLTPAKDKPFEVDIKKILENEFKGRKNPPEIEIVNTFVQDIGSLYTACDAVVSISSTEGFNLTLLEALACNSLVIAPRHGGQLDFLNDDNSLLINTGEMYAPRSMQYWWYDEKAIVGDPDSKHFCELMRKAYENIDIEKNRIKESAQETVKKFTWERAAKMILDLPIPTQSKRIYHKRKVLYIIPYRMSGGAEVWVREAIKTLDRNIYEPHIALIFGPTPSIDNLFKDLDVTIENLENQGQHKALKCLIEGENYSIVHFYNSFVVYDILKQIWKQGIRPRVVETFHSELMWKDSMAKVSKRENFVLAISCVSNMLAKKLIKTGNKNVVSLPQNIDWERFSIDERSKEILDEFNIPKDFVVGFVGRLSPEKNIPIVLKCAKTLPNVSFVIVGDGPQKEPLTQMATKNVYFIGERNDVEKFYPAFDVLLLPSHVEGLPLVILEAMCCGTPTIASDVGAISEVVNDSVNGFLVLNPNSADLFVQNIIKLQNKKMWNQCSNNCKVMADIRKNVAKVNNINNFYNLLFEGKK